MALYCKTFNALRLFWISKQSHVIYRFWKRLQTSLSIVGFCFTLASQNKSALTRLNSFYLVRNKLVILRSKLGSFDKILLIIENSNYLIQPQANIRKSWYDVLSLKSYLITVLQQLDWRSDKRDKVLYLMCHLFLFIAYCSY